MFTMITEMIAFGVFVISLVVGLGYTFIGVIKA